MTLESAIARFLEFLSAERNMAPSTVKAYGYDLERFRLYLAAHSKPRVERLEPYDLKDYLAHLREDRDCRPATIARVVSSLRTFFAFLADQQHIATNPAKGLHTPKKPRKLPLYLVASEARAALHADRHEEAWLRTRNDAILATLMMTGIRLAELVGLDLGDVDLDEGVIRVMGKGRKERLVPLNGPARTRLIAWHRERPTFADRPPAFFTDDNGDRISRRAVQYLVKKTAKTLGLDPRLSPHKLRHTFATTLYASEVDLREIQELLGHSNIASTSIYTHTNVDRVRAAVEKLKL